jgi:hypothetical protein
MAGGTGDLTRFLLNPKPPQDQKRRALVERAKDRGNEKRRTRIIKLHVSLDSSTAVIDTCAHLAENAEPAGGQTQRVLTLRILIFDRIIFSRCC